MSYLSEKEEDRVFYSLSPQQREQYFQQYRESGSVRTALDAVVGPVWFNQDGSPKGRRTDPPSGLRNARGNPVHFKSEPGQ